MFQSVVFYGEETRECRENGHEIGRVGTVLDLLKVGGLPDHTPFNLFI